MNQFSAKMFAATDDWLNQHQGEGRRILLTFDDGPSPYTEGILDILAEENIQALFFVVGQRIQNSQSARTLERMVNEGHLIGNHTDSHPKLTSLAPEQIRAELTRCHQRLTSLGIQPHLFRPPYGQCNQLVMTEAKALGYQPFFWNLDSLDWKTDLETTFWLKHTLTTAAQPQLVSDWNLSLNHLIIDLHDIHHNTLNGLRKLIQGIRSIPNMVFTGYQK